MLISALVIVGLLVLAASFAAAVWWFGSAGVRSLPEADWLRSFSVAKYRPMVRMLSEEDYRWLASQGLDKDSIRRLRAERRKIFGTYLTNLIRDFHRLHLAARMLLLAAQEDRPEMASRLVSVKVEFTRAILRVRFSLVLHDLGISQVDVTGLVAGIEAMHRDLRVLLPVPQPQHYAA